MAKESVAHLRCVRAPDLRIAHEEYVEATKPQLRKKILDANQRKGAAGRLAERRRR